MKKVLILDVDGTLTNSKKEITEKTLNALLEIQERGHLIVVASGRPTYGVKWITDVLQLKKYGGYVLSFNGARVFDVKNNRIIYQQIFPINQLKNIYEYAQMKDMGMITYEEDTVIVATREDDYIKFESNLNRMKRKVVDDFISYIDFDINKCLFTADIEEAPRLEKEMAQLFGDYLSIYRSEPFFIEAMPLGIDKAASLKYLFREIGVDVKDTIACGDGFNDISMIQYAGVGVAMANAQEVVKANADYITTNTNDADGLLDVIDRYFK